MTDLRLCGRVGCQQLSGEHLPLPTSSTLNSSPRPQLSTRSSFQFNCASSHSFIPPRSTCTEFEPEQTTHSNPTPRTLPPSFLSPFVTPSPCPAMPVQPPPVNRPRQSDASGTTTPSSSPPGQRSGGRHAAEKRKEAAAGRHKRNTDPEYIGPWKIGKTIGKGSSGELSAVVPDWTKGAGNCRGLFSAGWSVGQGVGGAEAGSPEQG